MTDLADRCQEIEQLLPSYALGGSEPEERRLVEAHIDLCPGCRELLAQYEGAAAGLLHAVRPVDPPEKLRAAILDRLEASGRLEAGRAGQPRGSWLRLAAAAAFGLLIALNLGLYLETRSLRQAQAALAEDLRASQAAMALVADPASRSAETKNEDLWAQLIYDPGRPVAVLYAWGLGDLPEGTEYQAWLVLADGTRVNAGVFRPSQDTPFTWILVRSESPVGHFVGFGVTIEPEGGSPAPTGPNVFRLDL